MLIMGHIKVLGGRMWPAGRTLPRPGLVVRMIVGSNLYSSKILDGNGVKAMPGSIPEPNSGTLYKTIQVTKWGISKKYLKNNVFLTKIALFTF